MVEPHGSALEKVLVNPVIDRGGPLCAAQSAAANWRARRVLTDRPPPAFLKGQAARHEGRCSAPSTTPCWREGDGPQHGGRVAWRTMLLPPQTRGSQSPAPHGAGAAVNSEQTMGSPLMAVPLQPVTASHAPRVLIEREAKAATVLAELIN